MVCGGMVWCVGDQTRNPTGSWTERFNPMDEQYGVRETKPMEPRKLRAALR
jgi:hypothetical protein